MKERPVTQSLPAAELARSLNDQELIVRTAEWRAISGRAESRRTEKGRVVATYPKEEGLLEEIRRLIAAESECCPSLAFTIDEQPDRIVVELRLPA